MGHKTIEKDGKEKESQLCFSGTIPFLERNVPNWKQNKINLLVPDLGEMSRWARPTAEWRLRDKRGCAPRVRRRGGEGVKTTHAVLPIPACMGI